MSCPCCLETAGDGSDWLWYTATLFESPSVLNMCMRALSFLAFFCSLEFRTCSSPHTTCCGSAYAPETKYPGYIWTRMHVSVQNTPPHLYAYPQTCTAGHKHCNGDVFDKLNPAAEISFTCHLTSQQGARRLAFLAKPANSSLGSDLYSSALVRVVRWPSRSKDINNPCWVRALQWPQELSGIQAADTLRQYSALPGWKWGWK